MLLAVSERDEELERLRQAPVHEPQVTTLFDPPLRLLDGPSFVPQYEDIFLREIYDFPAETERPVIIDGGANIGLAVLWWRARWPQARVLAFEPDPFAYEAMTYNLRYHQDLELHCVALSTPSLGTGFLSEGTDAGRLAAPDGQQIGTPLPVATVRLEEVLADLPDVDLLKLDIEGAETEVLRGAADRLDRVHRIFFEYHSFAGQRQTLADLLLLMRDRGFRVSLSAPMHGLRPFRGVNVDRGIDLRCNVWAWRESHASG